MKKLAICIPVYNRQQIFEYVLLMLFNSVQHYSEQVKIVISDNCSDDDLGAVFQSISEHFPSVESVYSRSEEFLSPDNNVLRVVSFSNAEFTWVIGSDDFINIANIENVIENLDRDNDFLLGNISHYNINFIELKNKNILTLDFFEKSPNYIKSKFESKKIFGKLSDFVSPVYPNFYLGAVMASVFRTSVWRKFINENIELMNNIDFARWYPHSYVFASAFFELKTVYINNEIITAGNGLRDWAGEGHLSLLYSEIPYIYIVIVPKLLNFYRLKGLKLSKYLASMNAISLSIGDYSVLLLFSIFIGSRIKSLSVQDYFKSMIIAIFFPNFYLGIIKGVIRIFIRKY